MKPVTAVVVLVSVLLFMLAPVAHAKESIQWLKGSKNLAAAQKKAGDENKHLLLNFFQLDCVASQRLDAVTYTNADVAEFINKNFVPVKLHLVEDREAVEKYEAVWTPTTVVAGADGTTYNASVGFLPPKEFLAQLWFGIAKVDFNRRKYAEAIKGFKQVVEQYPECNCTPEAMYWLGVSSYKLMGSADDLPAPAYMTMVWQELIEKYPDSIWATKTGRSNGKRPSSR